MDKEKALEYTRERLRTIHLSNYEEKDKMIVLEAIEYLKFIEKVLEG